MLLSSWRTAATSLLVSSYKNKQQNDKHDQKGLDAQEQEGSSEKGQWEDKKVADSKHRVLCVHVSLRLGSYAHLLVSIKGTHGNI